MHLADDICNHVAYVLLTCKSACIILDTTWQSCLPAAVTVECGELRTPKDRSAQAIAPWEVGCHGAGAECVSEACPQKVLLETAAGPAPPPVLLYAPHIQRPFATETLTCITILQCFQWLIEGYLR